MNNHIKYFAIVVIRLNQIGAYAYKTKELIDTCAFQVFCNSFKKQGSIGFL